MSGCGYFVVCVDHFRRRKKRKGEKKGGGESRTRDSSIFLVLKCALLPFVSFLFLTRGGLLMVARGWPWDGLEMDDSVTKVGWKRRLPVMILRILSRSKQNQ